MLRPCLALLLLAALGGCTTHRVSLEGLRPRASEAIDPRIPLPTEAVGKPVDNSFAGRVAAAERGAAPGIAEFDALLPRARAAASAAGASGSESWIAAQQLLSALVGSRAPLTQAIADIDTLAASQVSAAGDIGVTNRALLFAAAERLAAVDARQQSSLAAIRATLAR